MDLNIEAIDDIEARSQQTLEKIDNISADLYSLGGLEERLIFMSNFKNLLIEKHISGDQDAVDVLNWAWQKLAETE